MNKPKPKPRCPNENTELRFTYETLRWFCPVCSYTQTDDAQRAPLKAADKALADTIAAEREWMPSTAQMRDAILARFTERLDAIATRHPERLLDAIAVVVQAGNGRTVLVLSDPSTADLVKELERYTAEELPSPMTALLNSRLPI